MKPDKDSESTTTSSWQASTGTNLVLDSDFANHIVDSVGQGLLVTREGWRFEYVNPAFAKLVGCSTKDLIDKSMNDFIHNEDMAILNDARKKRLAGETTSYEARLIRSDGQVVYVQITGAPRWQEGKVVGSITIINNLTDHYIVEQKQRIYERTAELARTNEILLAEIVKRNRAEEILNMSVNEKEVLLREIHNKVKNNLELISCLLYMQSKKAVDEQPQAMLQLQNFQNHVKSMTMVHENLSRSHNLAKINLAEYVKSLIDNLFQSYNVHPDRIALILDVDKIMIRMDTAVSCGFVINELISNSLKHAFPEGRKGKINIEFHSDDEKGFKMVIRDNGIGFKTDLTKSNTLGLQLVTAVVEHIEGSIKLDSSGGTRLEIAFRETIYREPF